MPALVAPGGRLAIALYNDQGWRSRAWLQVKRCYCSGQLGRAAMTALFFPWFFTRAVLVSIVRGRNEFADYRRKRGMSIIHDWTDWLGGLPFEVAAFEQSVAFFAQRGFRLIHSRRTRRLGCNEFLFVAEAPPR
jgi:2-polyprenyl-6-hydroxyphenyl methylase/3-demethylubiquinone-9 3-methyltransferase